MSTHATHKSTVKGKAETLRRRRERQAKYINSAKAFNSTDYRKERKNV